MVFDPASKNDEAPLETPSSDALRAIRARLTATRAALAAIDADLRRALGEPPEVRDLPSHLRTRSGQRPRSRLAHDAEVRRFVEARMLDLIPYDEILAACRAAFGPERTPSRSALSRWWQLNFATPKYSRAPPRVRPRPRERG